MVIVLSFLSCLDHVLPTQKKNFSCANLYLSGNQEIHEAWIVTNIETVEAQSYINLQEFILAPSSINLTELGV